MANEKNVGSTTVDLGQNAHFTPNAELLARIRVVLTRPQHPGNVGAAARAIKTMGLRRLYLVAPQRFPDEEATARASGAADLLETAIVCESLDDALAGTSFAMALSARGRDIGPPTATARSAARTLVERAAGGEVALVFGGETAGLTNQDVQRCDLLVTIPTDEAYSSLNLGAAVQVLAYELRMAAAGDRLSPGKVTPFSSAPATRDDVENFFAHLEATMVATGFLDPKQPRRLLPKLRRLFGRSGLERDEVNILRGFLASVDALQRK